MKTIKHICACLILLSLLASCGSQQSSFFYVPVQPPAFTLTLLHMNDTHSHLEPQWVNIYINGQKTAAQFGGFARLKTLIDQFRAEDPNLLLLHAGDAVQGTLYFTVFNGNLDFDFLNILGVDAITFGNHEFDLGTSPIPGWINRSNFPWISANIDFSNEPAIAPLVKPYLIKQVNGERIGIIGVTTETTPQTTIDIGKAVFNDAVASARQQVTELAGMGINKIILLSHLGYQQDMALAAQVSGIDIIVGGHSHSLLGDQQQLPTIGLTPDGPYPTLLKAADGKPVLVLQAWQWGDVLGKLKVQFSADGEISDYNVEPTIPVGATFTRNGAVVQPDSQAYMDIIFSLCKTGTARIVSEDPKVAAMLAPYTKQLNDYRSVKVATATNDIVIGLNSGPGPLAADSMLAAVPNAQAAILNYGGVRRSLTAGVISVGDVLEVMPFSNTLVLVDLTGTELKQALEDGIDYLLTKYPPHDPPFMPFIGGIKFSVQTTAAKGTRVSSLQVRDKSGNYHPVQSATVYRTVTNAFVAGGGDGYTAIKNASGFRTNTGIIDSDAFREYLQKLGTVSNPTEQRISVTSSVSAFSLLQFGSADNYWFRSLRHRI